MAVADDEFAERLKLKLAPETVGVALIRAGAFLTGYELVKASILEGVRDFFLTGFDVHEGKTYSQSYQLKVLPLGKNPFDASLAWLVQNDALTAAQAAALDSSREHRHEVAHELARFLVDVDADVDVERLRTLHGIMRSLDRFWGSIEVDIDPDFDGVEVDRDHIRSGSGALFEYLMQVAGLGESAPPGS